MPACRGDGRDGTEAGTCKTVFDPVHGSIRFSGIRLELLDRHELQRLRSIRQLDMGHLVFPGANHTRFEHSLGTYHLASRMAEALGLAEPEREAVAVAGMLHDIAHAPFSHTLEDLIVERTGKDHMRMARDLITGAVPGYPERDADLHGGLPSIAEMLTDAGIDAGRVCDIIEHPRSQPPADDWRASFSPGDHVHQIIHGPIDADQMDYLLRDAHYTGVKWGVIDVERILDTVRVHNGRLVIDRSGAVAAEGLMMARSMMYSAVYYHMTVRIFKMMLVKAVECSDLDLAEVRTLTDAELVAALVAEGGRPSLLARSVMARRPYKTAFVLRSEEADAETSAMLAEHTSSAGRRRLEAELAARLDLDASEVIVDLPSESALLAKSRPGKTGVGVLGADGGVQALTRLSPVAKGLQSRDPFGWKLAVSTVPGREQRTAAAVRRMLSL